MQDLVFQQNSPYEFTITVAEQQVIIDANEEEDTFGVQEDLTKLYHSRDKSNSPIQIRVLELGNNPRIKYTHTANESWEI